MPILQSLTITRDTTGNRVLTSAIQNVHDSVKEGESMTQPLSQCKVFPPMVVSMVEVGEETGALADMLTRIANTYDDEVDNAVAGMTAAIEPALIIVLAVVVGTIVIAMFLPMVKIIGSVSGAGARGRCPPRMKSGVSSWLSCSSARRVRWRRRRVACRSPTAGF